MNYDPKNERYIVNGSHESSKLQDLLDGFIQKYVLCPSCHNPETVLGVNSKRGTITTSCQACGYTGQINNKDRLTTFILKNPPSSSNGGATSASPKEGKKGKKGKKDEKNGKKQSNGDATNNSGDANDSNDGPEIPDGDIEDEDNEEWGENLDPEATAKRLSELTAGVKNLVVTADLEKSPVDRLTMFFDYVKVIFKWRDHWMPIYNIYCLLSFLILRPITNYIIIYLLNRIKKRNMMVCSTLMSRRT